MNWSNRFARCTQQMRTSAVRELLKVTAQPGMISFAGGLPAQDLFPIDRVRSAMEAVLIRRGAAALQYGETEGLAELRDWIASQFSTAHVRVTRQQVAIVSGAQQALDLLGRIFLDPGDRVIVENPAYLALLSAWRPLGAEFLPVAVDASGLSVQEVEKAITYQPKLVYSVPNFQNPTGATLSLERRRALVGLLPAGDLVLIEDDPYRQLRFSGEALPTLFEMDLAQNDVTQRRVVSVGSFSKILFPGLRVGWVVGPERVIAKLVQAKQAADLHTSTLNQELVWELIREGFLETHVPFLCDQYRARRDAMLEALETHFPADTSWTRPEGGMFLMVQLPPDRDAKRLLQSALPHQVAFVPGEDFHLGGLGANTLRLNFTHSKPELIREGIKRLGQLLQEPKTSAARQFVLPVLTGS